MYLKNVKSGLAWEITDEAKAAKMLATGGYTQVEAEIKTPKYEGKALATMTVAELKAIAAKNEVDLEGTEKKADIVEKLTVALAARLDNAN